MTVSLARGVKPRALLMPRNTPHTRPLNGLAGGVGVFTPNRFPSADINGANRLATALGCAEAVGVAAGGD